MLGVRRFERFYCLIGIFNLRYRSWLGDRSQMVVVGSVASLLKIAERSGYVGNGRLLKGFHNGSDVGVNAPLPSSDLATGLLEPVVAKSASEFKLIFCAPVRQEVTPSVAGKTMKERVVGR